MLHLIEDARCRVCIAEAAASNGKIQSGRKGLLVEGAKLRFALLLQCPEALDDALFLQSRAALCTAGRVAFRDILAQARRMAAHLA